MANDPPWPACTSEERPWDRSHTDLVPRSRRTKILPTYRAAITPTIAAQRSIEVPGSLAGDLAQAEAAIARFDERVGGTLAGFTVVALRTEAASSSQIENLTASPSSIAVAELAPSSSGPMKPNAELIAANVATLAAAMIGDGPLAAQEIIEIQRVLLSGSAPQLTGDVRTEQVWVGGDSYSPHGARYVAPHQDRVRPAIDDLVDFANRDDLGALAHIAIAHAHFETIHPFPDGNGRTGRVIVQRMLRNAGLTRKALLPLSAGLLADTDRYFEALDDYRRGEIAPIVTVFVAATFHSLGNSTTLAERLTDIRASWNDAITARADAVIWRLLDYCIARPAITATAAARDLEASTVAVQNAIDTMAVLGLLRQHSPAKRNRIWLVTEVIDAIEEFMARSLRR